MRAKQEGMPKGTSDNRLTNKTEFMRYLNEHEREIPSLSKLRGEYRKLHLRGDNFGYWLRYHQRDAFIKAYSAYWLKHPELYDQVYNSP